MHKPRSSTRPIHGSCKLPQERPQIDLTSTKQVIATLKQAVVVLEEEKATTGQIGIENRILDIHLDLRKSGVTLTRKGRIIRI